MAVFASLGAMRSIMRLPAFWRTVRFDACDTTPYERNQPNGGVGLRRSGSLVSCSTRKTWAFLWLAVSGDGLCSSRVCNKYIVSVAEVNLVFLGFLSFLAPYC